MSPDRAAGQRHTISRFHSDAECQSRPSKSHSNPFTTTPPLGVVDMTHFPNALALGPALPHDSGRGMMSHSASNEMQTDSEPS
jgi:hypothetical protein